MRRAISLVVAASVALASACAPPALPPRTVSLRVASTSGPADANVYIDDQLVGQLDYVIAHGVALPPGVHRITVQAPGYFPVDREVLAKSAKELGATDEAPVPIRIDVVLTPIPD